VRWARRCRQDLPLEGLRWITEYTITYQGRSAYTVSIMEFRDGKVVHETQYFAAPSRRRPSGANGFSRWREGACIFRVWTGMKRALQRLKP
jgi:hypothetical protein